MNCKIKFCGMTRVEDAIAARDFGVIAIGLMFHAASPRAISIEQAKLISDAVSEKVSVVAVFANEAPAFVQTVIEQVPLHALQFHGDESEEYCKQFGMTYIKACRVQSSVDIEQALRAYPSAMALLLDAYHPDKLGGTGEAFSWQLIPQIEEQRIILAGGLTIDNVGQAVSQVKPFAVDVSSGIEISPGIKDPNKMRQFITEVLNERD